MSSADTVRVVALAVLLVLGGLATTYLPSTEADRGAVPVLAK